MPNIINSIRDVKYKTVYIASGDNIEELNNLNGLDVNQIINIIKENILNAGYYELLPGKQVMLNANKYIFAVNKHGYVTGPRLVGIEDQQLFYNN